MDPITGKALIGAGASILGNIFGMGSQDSANKTNLQIAQMNNEFNERMLDKQMAYNLDMYNRQWSDQTKQTWDMWNANNEYNSASSQVQRLKDAGLNPAMTFGSGAAGMAQGSGGSAPSALGVNAPQAQQVQVQPFKYDLSGVSGIVQTLLDIQAQRGVRSAQEDNLREGAAGLKIENKYRADRIVRDIYESESRRVLNESQERLNNMSFAKMQATFSADVAKAEREALNTQWTGDLIRANTACMQMQGMLSSKELQYFDANARLQLAIGAAQQYSLVAAGKCSEAQAKQAIANSVKLYAETNGIKVDNYVKQQTADALIKTARNNSNTSYWISKDTKNAYDYNKDSRKLGVWKQSLDLFNPFSSVGRVGELMLRSK